METTRSSRYALAVHGGAGVIVPSELTPEREAAFGAGLRAALAAGEAVLRAGGSALDAVEASVAVLEDEPLFNAGRGSVLNRDGICEMDAAIMDGASGRAGAVGAVRRVRNPVRAARAVLERTTHVLVVGEGADALAAAEGLEMMAMEYFVTEPRRRQWREVIEALRSGPAATPLWPLERRTEKVGTVGAVAVDRRGHVAAATSTGGMAGKLPGRIGDSPVIGAGTYADDATGAVSATGHGEFFIRHVVAHEVTARVRHGGLTLADAARRVVLEELAAAGGEGGLIAVDRAGTIAMPFNTPGMYRGSVREGEAMQVAIFEDRR